MLPGLAKFQAWATHRVAPTRLDLEIGLLDDSLILKAGRLLGGRGQPATKLVVNPDGAFSIGLNIDRDHIAVVALDFQGKVRARVSQEVHFAMPEDVVAFVKAAIAEMEASQAISICNILKKFEIFNLTLVRKSHTITRGSSVGGVLLQASPFT